MQFELSQIFQPNNGATNQSQLKETDQQFNDLSLFQQNNEIIIIKNIIYALDNETKSAQVIGNEDANGNIFIQQFIEHKSRKFVVAKISQGSFKNSSMICSIILPVNSQIKTFEKDVFSNSTIESLIISSSVSQLDEGWCSNTPNLNRIVILPNNKNFMCVDSKMIIEKKAQHNDYDILVFVRRDIRKVSIPSFIKQIGSYAFENTSIKEIIIPNNVTTICKSAFNHCRQLQNVIFTKDSKLHKIEKDSFPDTIKDSIDFPINYKNQFKEERDIFISAIDKTSLDEVTNVLEIIDNSNDAIELMISNCSDDENA